MSGPTADFWEERYRTAQTGWDRGGASPQLHAWLAAELLTPGVRIAVPGCGRGWEVAALAQRGFRVTGIDYAAAAVAEAQARLAAQDLAAEIIQADVLHWQPHQPFDAVYEQTCLCALHPDFWQAYADNLARWLTPGGRLLALFMQRPTPEGANGVIQGPPYHCDINAMRALFPSHLWDWDKPPYAQVAHPAGLYELALTLTRRG